MCLRRYPFTHLTLTNVWPHFNAVCSALFCLAVLHINWLPFPLFGNIFRRVLPILLFHSGARRYARHWGTYESDWDHGSWTHECLRFGLTGTQLAHSPLSEPSGAEVDKVGVLTDPLNHLSGRDPGLRAVSARRPGSQSPYWVSSLGLGQGRTLLGRCWVPMPAPTAPETHGLRKPGCPLQRTGGWGRDSA